MPTMCRTAVTIGTGAAALVWRTVTGQSGGQVPTTEETTITVAAGRFRSGTFTQPLHIIVANTGTKTLYLGTATVTTLTGIPLLTTATRDWTVVGEDAIYGISGTGTLTIHVAAGPAPR